MKPKKLKFVLEAKKIRDSIEKDAKKYLQILYDDFLELMKFLPE